jgi:hypothetical protein
LGAARITLPRPDSGRRAGLQLLQGEGAGEGGGMSARSDTCIQGRHDECDGTNLDNMAGCECDCHFEETADHRHEDDVTDSAEWKAWQQKARAKEEK